MAAGGAAIAFGASAAWWWVAHQLTWWAYGLAGVAWVFGYAIVKTIRERSRRGY